MSANVTSRTKEGLNCDQPYLRGAVLALSRAPFVIAGIRFNHIRVKRVLRQHSRIAATDVSCCNKIKTPVSTGVDCNSRCLRGIKIGAKLV